MPTMIENSVFFGSLFLFEAKEPIYGGARSCIPDKNATVEGSRSNVNTVRGNRDGGDRGFGDKCEQRGTMLQVPDTDGVIATAGGDI